MKKPGLLLACLAGASILTPVLVFAVLAAALFWLPPTGSLPEENELVQAGITRVYDVDGKEIGAFHRFETSVPTEASDLPDVLMEAVVAIEDRRFFDHDGADSRAVMRAAWKNITEGEYAEGASTITQQYVKRAYLSESEGILDKLREIVVARRLEERLSKEEILFRYLSTAYFGAGNYGVGAASLAYFRKPVNDLGLSEAALLAGLLRAPSELDPRSQPSGADDRRRLVLDAMRDQGRISAEQHATAVAEKVKVLADGDTIEDLSGPATAIFPVAPQMQDHSYFMDYVRRYLVTTYGEETVFEGGLRVETSLDPRLQRLAEESVARTLQGTRPPLEMALVSVEPATGFVRALVGGRDFESSNVNLALGGCPLEAPVEPDQPVCVSGGGTGRQPGSAFKPFTLARALEEGRSLTSGYPAPATYRFPGCGQGPGCTVSNAGRSGYGWLNLRQATVNSVNTVFAQLVNDVGVADTAELAHRLGLTAVNPDGEVAEGGSYGPSITLGTPEVAPLDMAAAFSVFANGGRQLPATPIVRVVGPDGKVLENNTSRHGEQVLDRRVAEQVNDVLADVISFGTGRAASFGEHGTMAGKTGTTENYSDAWFVGYTGLLSTAVWMGHSDSRQPLTNIKGESRVFGGTFPARTWADFMSKALEGRQLPQLGRSVAPPSPGGPAGGSDEVVAPTTTPAAETEPTTPTTTIPETFATFPTVVPQPPGRTTTPTFVPFDPTPTSLVPFSPPTTEAGGFQFPPGRRARP